jgi:hypothetical protein
VRTSFALGCGVAALMAGCSAILGMDAPTLDPCVSQGSCSDVTTGPDAPPLEAAEAMQDVTSEGVGPSDANPPYDADAAPVCLDALPDDAAAGVLCGGGCYPVSYCNGGTPICCVSTDDLGVTTYACTASETACAGYSVHCINENDCGGTDVCCHFSSHMVCDSVANCPAQDLGCVPGSSQDCPTGKQCDVTIDVAGKPTPYFTCEP